MLIYIYSGGETVKILIDEKLKEIGKTRYWLSVNTGITYPAMKKLCDGLTESIRFENIENICKAINCEMQDIFEIER